MLVLKCSAGEEVIIGLPDGREIVVRLMSCSDQAGRLGFDAPPDISVDRKAIAEAKKRSRHSQHVLSPRRQPCPDTLPQ